MKYMHYKQKTANHFFRSAMILSVLLLTGILSANAAVSFTENKGQWNEQALYRSELPGGNVFLTHDGFMFTFQDAGDMQKAHDLDLRSGQDVRVKCHTYKVTFKNSSAKSVNAYSVQQGYSNYFIGNDRSKWASRVLSYAEVVYENLYPNIDLKVYSDKGAFKYDLILHPGAKISDIVMHEEGVDKIELKNGTLVYHTSVGDIAEQIPSAYIQLSTSTKKVPCDFKINGHDISFDIKDADIAGQEFVIDPALQFSTFSNSSISAFGCNGSYDSSGRPIGSAVVNGQGWPVSLGAYDISFAGSTDVGVHKFDPVNASSVWATYIGGTSTDIPMSMLCNSNDEFFVLSSTFSSDYPVGSFAYDPTYNGNYDMAMTKLSMDGTQLLGSTYIGGSNDDGSNANIIAVTGNETAGDFFLDASGDPVVGWFTNSTDFPVVGGIQASNAGGYDGCIFKLNSSLSSLTFSTYLGGNGDDIITAIAKDPTGNIVVTGATMSNNFPVTTGVYQSSKLSVGDADAFVSVLDMSGGSLLHSTYFGPTTNAEKGFRTATNSAGEIYVFGVGAGTLPVTSGTYSNQTVGAFVAKFNSTLSTLMLCNAFGNGMGGLCLIPTAFNVDDCDQITCASFTTTASSGAPMPTTPDAYMATSIDNQDIYINIFTKDLDTLVYGSYIGSSTYEHSHGGYSRFDHSGNLYYALCTQNSFPVSSPTYCSFASGYDMVCFKMNLSDLCIPTAPPVPDFLCSQNNICPGSCVNFTNYSTNATSYYWSFPGGTPSSSTATNPSGICFSAPGTYNISLTATNAGSSVTLTRASLITVYVPVPVTLVQTGDTIFATPGFILYEWFYNGVPVTSGQQPWFVPTQNGTYSVTALDNHDCASEYTLPNVIASVSDNLNAEQGISIYPNPNAGSFTIEIASGNGWKNFILTDVTGKVLISEKIEGNKILIDRRRVNLAAAVYLCHFRSDSGSMTRKVIIE